MAILAGTQGFSFDGTALDQFLNFYGHADELVKGTSQLANGHYNIPINTEYTLEVIDNAVVLKLKIPISSIEGEDTSIVINDTIYLKLSNEVLFACAKKLHDKAIRAKLVNDSLEGLE